MFNEINAAASCLAFFERAVAREKQLSIARERARLEMRSAIKKMTPQIKPSRIRKAGVSYKVRPTPEQLAILDRADEERWTLKRLAAELGWSVSRVWTLRTERDHERKTARLKAHRAKFGPGNGKPPPNRPATKYGRRGILLTPEQIEYFEQAVDSNAHVDEITSRLGMSRKVYYDWRLYYWHDKTWLRRYMAETAALRAAQS
jgi:hypothetical protein